MAKSPKPLASYYAGGHRQVVAGVPMRFARPPCGPEDRAARTAGGRGFGGLSRPTHPSDEAAVKAWQAMPIEERLALQDAALARVASVAPTVETEAPAMPENLPAERIGATPTPATLPPEPVSSLDGAESATVGASEPEPAADPEPVAAVAPDAPVSLADMLRQAADRIEALERERVRAKSDASYWQEAARQHERDALANKHAADRWAAAVTASQIESERAYRQREGRRRALLALRKARAESAHLIATRMPNELYSAVLKQREEQRNRAQIAESRVMILESDLARLKAAPAPEPIAPPPAPKPDPVAAARAQMRKMGLQSTWKITAPNPAQNVRVVVAA